MPKRPGNTTQKYNDISVHGKNFDQEGYRNKQELTNKPIPFFLADDYSKAQELQTSSPETFFMTEQLTMFFVNL